MLFDPGIFLSRVSTVKFSGLLRTIRRHARHRVTICRGFRHSFQIVESEHVVTDQPCVFRRARCLLTCVSTAARKVPPLASNAQGMRAILLASATATTLNGLRARSRVGQEYFSGCSRARFNTAYAPTTRMRRK
jgi:hypothetical protein